MIVNRMRRSGPLLLAAGLLGAVVSPGAALADGPGYGGTADALTVQWHQAAAAGAGGLAVYAVGFRGGSPVNLRVGATAEQAVTADAAGALRVLVVGAASPVPAPTADTTVLPVGGTSGDLSTGTSVLAVGQTPTGDLRTLVGSVPPPATGVGVRDVAPWAGAGAAMAGAVLWLRRRNPAAAAGQVQGHRYAPRHRG